MAASNLRRQIDGWFLRLTARRWNRLIARVLCRAYEDRVITSRQLHVLTREFDPTQNGTVGQLPRITEPHFALRAVPASSESKW